MERNPVVVNVDRNILEEFRAQLPSNMAPTIDRWFELRGKWMQASTEAEQAAISPEMIDCVNAIEQHLLLDSNYALNDGKNSFFIKHMGNGALICARIIGRREAA